MTGKTTALLGFRLSNMGQMKAKQVGLPCGRDHIITVKVTPEEMYLFHIDEAGFLIGATYTGCRYGYRKLLRFSWLSEDVSLDEYPTDWRTIITKYRQVTQR